jgi:hypothetical protein
LTLQVYFGATLVERGHIEFELAVGIATHPAVVPAKAGTHMWTAPRWQEVVQQRIGSLAIICPVC